MPHPLPFHPDDIDAVLFDLDGTLIDSDDEDVNRWAQRIARLYGTPPKNKRTARRLVMALESPVNALFTALDLVGLDTPVVRLMIALQGTKPAGHLPPIDGVAHLIDQLAPRYKLAVVSTRTVEEGRAFLRGINRQEQFGAFAGRDTTWRIKPHPQPVQYAAHKLGVDPARCLMVGDTTVDIKAGRRAGAWTCGVLCGYGQRRELTRAGAHLILDHTAQLADWLG